MKAGIMQEQVAGQGEDRPVSEDALGELKQMVDEIRTDYADQIRSARDDNHNTRYALWEGQDPDGRKWKENLNREVKPFNGAADNRFRLADMIGQERVMFCKAAAFRGEITARGTESGDAARASRIGIYLDWLRKQRWGAEWYRTVELLAQYREFDTPAVAVAQVDWFQELCLQYREITRAEVAEALLALGGGAATEVDVGQINDLLMNPAQAETLAEALRQVLGIELKPARQKKLALEIITTGVGRVPEPYVKVDEPRVEALRLYDDVFVKGNVLSAQRAAAWVRRHWLTRAEVLERQATLGWSEAFVRGLIGDDDGRGHEGKSGFDDELMAPEVTEAALNSVDQRKGLYEVLVSYRRAVNEDGVLGIFVETFSYFVDVAATERQLWDRKHGQYPFVAMPREYLTARLMDSRGIPELVGTDQHSLKRLSDSFEDHTQLAALPPVRRPTGRPNFKIAIGPLADWEESRPNSIGFVDPPKYPQSVDAYIDRKRQQVNEYFGRFDQRTNPNEALAFLHQQNCVDGFLAGLGDVFQLVVQLAQQYETSERLARITGMDGEPLARSVEEIQGKFDVGIAFDVRDLDMEKLLKKAKLVVENLSILDQTGTLPKDQILRTVVGALDPHWAQMMPPSGAVTARVTADEEANFVKILNGVRPAMPEVVDAPTVRAEVLQRNMEPRLQNPAAFGPMSPAAVALYNERLEYLTFQGQQIQNAQTGRTGVQPVDLATVGQPEAAPAGGGR